MGQRRSKLGTLLSSSSSSRLIIIISHHPFQLGCKVRSEWSAPRPSVFILLWHVLQGYIALRQSPVGDGDCGSSGARYVSQAYGGHPRASPSTPG
ncbi:hypothetical protein Tco_1466551 [Tanacetum coccineum]